MINIAGNHTADEFGVKGENQVNRTNPSSKEKKGFWRQERDGFTRWWEKDDRKVLIDWLPLTEMDEDLRGHVWKYLNPKTLKTTKVLRSPKRTTRKVFLPKGGPRRTGHCSAGGTEDGRGEGRGIGGTEKKNVEEKNVSRRKFEGKLIKHRSNLPVLIMSARGNPNVPRPSQPLDY